MKKITAMAPFLLAIYPFLFIFNQNKGELPLNVVWLPVTAVFVAVAVLFFVVKFVSRETSKSVMISSMAVVAFFYYGLFYNLLYGKQIGDFVWGRHTFLLPVWTLFFLYASYRFLVTKKALKELAAVFTFSAAVLIVPAFVSILAYGLFKPDPGYHAEIDFDSEEDINTKGLKTNSGQPPDIYYIIPDAYAGYNALEKYFGFKNKEFYDYLESKGFTIARNSRSNYVMSYSSISSTLDMRYIDFLGDIFGTESLDVLPLREIIASNRTKRSLRDTGYEYVHVYSDLTTVLDDESGDEKIDSGTKELTYFFLSEVLKTTVLRFWQGRLGFGDNAIFAQTRNDILTAFDDLSKATKIKGPKFVFAHIASPHGPYVFGPNGEEVGSRPFSNFKHTTEDEIGLYLDQLVFINKKLTFLIEEILSQSKTPPIIIIQSDHGVFIPGSKYSEEEIKRVRFQNLSAYYLPSIPKKPILPQDMSNVNTFRFIFDKYFGTDYGLLENKSYYSDTRRYYLLEEIDDVYRDLVR